MPIRCLIVDDHTLFREGLRRLLESEAGIEVVGEARDASEAIEAARMLKPDVVLMDIGMPGLSSFEASRRITRELPGRRVIFLTMYEDEEYLLQCLDAGASGYILKGVGSSELTRMVRAVHQGEMTITPSLAARLLASIGKKHHDPSAYDQSALTPREDEVLDQVARGWTNKQIARTLRLSEKTIKHHMTSIMQKLHVRNRVEAAIRSRRMTLSRGPDKSSN